MTAHRPSERRSGDFLGNPLAAVLWWGLPLAAGWTADVLRPPAPVEAAVWAAALAWMGTGCALNARRCHRLHCYIAAPILLLGAAGVLLVALGIAPLGAGTASYLINGTLLLALLSFLIEPIWGKYAAH